MNIFRPSQVALISLALGAVVGVQAQEAQIQVLGIGDSEVGERFTEGAMSFTMDSSVGGISIGNPLGGVDPNNRSQLFKLLSNESVRKELELEDEQFEVVRKIVKESQKRMSQLIQAKMKAGREAGGAIRLGGNEFREIMEENQKQAESAIEEILLPEQLKRVRQLAYQIDIQQEGLGESLVSGRLGEEIGVHDDQKQNLLDRAAKIEAEAKAAINAIRAQARAKLFRELTPEQRKEAEELLGGYFHYEELSLGQQLRRSLKMARDQQEEKDGSKRTRGR